MSESARPDPTHVLVVDDDPRIRQAVCWALEDEGYSVAEAGDAEQAIAVASQQLPAVVVLDFGLPLGDGASVARELRAVTGRPTLPVVIVTADGRASEKAARAGAVAYFHKPFDVEELLHAVRGALP